MDKEIMGAMIPMMVFRKEIYEFVEGLIKEKFKDKNRKELLTVKEAAIFLNVKVSWLRQAVFRKEINHIKVGALVRFREEDLLLYIQQNLKSFDQS